MEQKDKPELFGAGQSRYMVPNKQQRKGKNLEKVKGNKCSTLEVESGIKGQPEGLLLG